MARNPVPLARPVVVLGGYRAPRISVMGLARRLQRLTSARADDFLWVGYPERASIKAAAAHALARLIARGWGGLAVDVVGFSMGGLVARALSAGFFDPASTGQFRPARLFTIATPHRGARLAELWHVDSASRDMRPGSNFLAQLDKTLPGAPYELIPYATLMDWWVGATRAAPPGHMPRWVPPSNPIAKALSHFSASFDSRILADIARRLRSETPIWPHGSPPPRD